jgi:hypothetical protein
MPNGEVVARMERSGMRDLSPGFPPAIAGVHPGYICYPSITTTPSSTRVG